jgi:hypothetical protein
MYDPRLVYQLTPKAPLRGMVMSSRMRSTVPGTRPGQKPRPQPSFPSSAGPSVIPAKAGIQSRPRILRSWLGPISPGFVFQHVNSRTNGGEPSGRELTGSVRIAATFLDHQRLSPFGNLVELLLANTPLGYNNILGGGGSRGAGSSCPVLHMLIAGVSSSLRQHLAVPVSVPTVSVRCRTPW